MKVLRELSKYLLTIIYFVFLFQNSFASKEYYDLCKKDWSPLMRAIYKGNNIRVARLIKNGANVNFTTPNKKCMWILTPFDIAIRKNNLIAAELLLKTNKIIPDDHMIIASRSGSAEMVELLIKFGANPNYFNEDYAAIIEASSGGSIDKLKCLLDYGANCNLIIGENKISPLMCAAAYGNISKVKLLLDYGANKYHIDIDGKTALNYLDYIHQYDNISEEVKKELKDLLK